MEKLQTFVHDNDRVSIIVLLRHPKDPDEEEAEASDGDLKDKEMPVLGDPNNPIFKHVSLAEIQHLIGEEMDF